MDLINDLIEKGVLKTPRIIDAFRVIKRIDFMPRDIQPLADLDEAFPIGEDQTISQPYTVALMLELLDPEPGDIILDVGLGSGWQTALLAHIVGKKGEIHSVERIKSIYEFGKKNIEAYSSILGKRTVRFYLMNAEEGLPIVSNNISGFDKIITATSSDDVLQSWKEQLTIDGRMVIPVDHSLWLITKKKDGTFSKKEYPGFAFAPLVKEKVIPVLPIGNIIMNIVASLFALLLIAFVYSISPPNIPYPKEIIVPVGSTARDVVRTLANERIVRFENVILLHLFFRGDLGRIQAGVYLFDRPHSSLKVADIITDPPLRAIITVRIPESSTLRGVAIELENAGLFSREEFWNTAGTPPTAVKQNVPILPVDISNFVQQFKFLESKPIDATLEGYLFSDTYDFFDDAKPREITFKMLQNFEKRLLDAGLFNEITSQGRSLHEVIILASLLEKEAITYEDKRIIAGIINNRLEKDIPLQLDASLMYITGRGSSLLTKNDLALISPYNTYTKKGLPIGPIANPGIDSIRAVLDPEKTPYFYYLSDSNFKIHYSKTFEEHKQKKAIYIP